VVYVVVCAACVVRELGPSYTRLGSLKKISTSIDEGVAELKGQKMVKLPVSGVVWLDTSESATQSTTVGGVTTMAIRVGCDLLWRCQMRQVWGLPGP
jgi:hypothetical protein